MHPSYEDIQAILHQSGVVAVVRLDDLSAAVTLAHVLLANGIRALELTMSNAEALTVRARLVDACPEFSDGSAILGVGTVRTVEQAEAALAAGAHFIVSPTVSVPVITTVRQHDVPMIAGALTPSEIETAWRAGATMVKIFPASVYGPTYLKLIHDPMPEIPLLPTGGIGREQIGAYIQQGAIAVGMGGKLVDKQRIVRQEWDAIAQEAAGCVAAVQAARQAMRERE